MKTSGKPFSQRVQAALSDSGLFDRLHLATARFADARVQSMARVPDAEEWRERARAIRKEAVDHLDAYLEEFIRMAQSSGARVHIARTREEASRTAAEIAKAAGAGLAVKSKSMVSEEIGLNGHLGREGIQAVETDLGEYIVQLAREGPSHIIGPAIHKDRAEIAELFSAENGAPVGDTTEDLGGFARRRLREAFLRADVGISGVNFGVAETGTIALVSNEGNARMVTSKPRVHIALMGIERIVPRFADLHVLLQMLTRNATGQPITTYVTLLTGPRREGDADGPEELHIVLVDGGRSGLLGSKYQEALHCIRCGACLNVCPVFRQIGGHGYGSVYSGPIGAVLTPLLDGLDEWKELPFASSLCGACTEVCPVKIPLHEMLVDLREDAVERGLAPPGERLAFAAYREAVTRPARYRRSLRGARLIQRFFMRDGRLRFRRGPMAGWTSHRTLLPLADRPFRERFSEIVQDVRGQEAEDP